jgi:hypothetical protein
LETSELAQAKKVKLHLESHPHDFDIRIQGDVAWVIVFVDTTTVVNNEAARAFHVARSSQ